MDFSAFLILPLSGFIAFAMVIVATIGRWRRPRLMWPCAISTVLSTMVFLKVGDVSALDLTTLALFWMFLSAAIGTVVGAAAAKLMMAVFGRYQRPSR